MRSPWQSIVAMRLTVGAYILLALMADLIRPESLANHVQHRPHVPHHQLRGHPDHPVAEPPQLPIPPHVSPRAAGVIPAVHFHDEPDTGRAEVDDVLADDDLPPKRDAETAAAELSPEQRLRRGGSQPHGAGARSEELSTSTAHRNLRGPGEGPDRAPTGAGSVTRPSPLAQICRLIFTLASGTFAGAAQNVRHWRGPALSPDRGPSVAAAAPRLARRPRAAPAQPPATTTSPLHREVLPPSRLDLLASVLLHPRASARALARASTDLEEAGERSAAKPREHPPGGGRRQKTLSDGATWKYTWDGHGRLREVERPDKKKVAFTYDAFGRRTTKTFDGKTTEFVWDGDDLVHERIRDAGGTVASPVTTWVFEPGMFTPLAKLEGRKRFGIVTDHLGTPAILTTEAGAIAWRAQLDVYGVAREEEGVARDEDRTANPWRFPGQYEDAETGLYYNRFRYYDPELGRYLSEDPIGLRGGMGLYGYVQEPSLQADALGLSSPGVTGPPRAGSALKIDPHHAFPDVVDNFAREGARFDIPTRGAGGTIVRLSELLQVEGSLPGQRGVFEWIVDKGSVTHRRFIPGGTITGTPNQRPGGACK